VSYNTGQGQLSRRGNLWAMIKSCLEVKGSINASMQSGGGALACLKATYDFAVDGGAQTTISPKSSPIVPAGAIIMAGVIYPITLPVGPGASIAIGFGSAGQAALIKGATAIATYVAGAPLVVLPVWTGTTFFEVAAAGPVTFTISGAVLTDGKIAVHLVYFMKAE
jgi:hypothetical protein